MFGQDKIEHKEEISNRSPPESLYPCHISSCQSRAWKILVKWPLHIVSAIVKKQKEHWTKFGPQSFNRF